MKRMKKSDLKSMMRVEYRKHGIRIVVITEKGMMFCNQDGYVHSRDFDSDLTYRRNTDFDIIAVYDAPSSVAYSLNTEFKGDLLWKENNVVDYNDMVEGVIYSFHNCDKEHMFDGRFDGLYDTMNGSYYSVTCMTCNNFGEIGYKLAFDKDAFWSVKKIYNCE